MRTCAATDQVRPISEIHCLTIAETRYAAVVYYTAPPSSRKKIHARARPREFSRARANIHGQLLSCPLLPVINDNYAVFGAARERYPHTRENDFAIISCISRYSPLPYRVQPLRGSPKRNSRRKRPRARHKVSREG